MKYQCKRCNSEWVSREKRLTGAIPVQCPRCKRTDWWKEAVDGGTDGRSQDGEAVVAGGKRAAAYPAVDAVKPSRPRRQAVAFRGDAKPTTSLRSGNDAEESVKPSKGWFPASKCPHGWQNSFVCERNRGGCNQ